MKNKIKEKIEKLLNLSMSDNEHEASLALDKALKLMNEHNITKDEVYRQNFISKEIPFTVNKVQDWQVDLYSRMANISGCIFTWRNGIYSLKAKGQITGRERDVENATYLIDFLSREIENKTKKYKIQIQPLITSKKKSLITSFKKGLIQSVYSNLYHQQNKFFSQEEKSTGLICINLESKLEEAEAYFRSVNKVLNESKTKSTIYAEGLNAGYKAGKEIELNNAINKQEEILKIEDIKKII